MLVNFVMAVFSSVDQSSMQIETDTTVGVKSKLAQIEFDKNSGRIEKLTHQYINTNPDLRFLVRESGTEPLIRTLVEGENKDQVNSISLKLSLGIKRILNA